MIITESPPFFLHHATRSGSKTKRNLPVREGRRQRKISPEQVQPMRSIGQAQRSTNQQCGDVCLPHGRPRAGNVSPKGGSVCTCIVSKQQYGVLLLFACRASCLFAAGARRDHILPRRLRVAHDRKMIRSFAQNPVRSLQSDAQKFPARVTSLLEGVHERLMSERKRNGN